MTTQRSTLYTGPTAEDLDRIPADLKARPQWVLWRGEDRIDQQTGEVKLNKIPIDPQTLHNADTTDPTTWGTFEQCVAALPIALEEWEHENPDAYRGGGIGFVFAADDPYAGIDLDHCVNPDTGAIADWAQAHIDTLASYTEVTPSGTGLHTLVQGALPPRGRKKGSVEMYSYARFFTMTGWHVPGAPHSIEQRQDELTAFHGAIFGTAQGSHQHGTAPQAASTPLLDDAALLDKARAAKKGVGAKFSALFSGDWTGYPSQSEADLSLCIRLAFWTQDAAQIDRLFRQSGLLRPKWDEQRGTQTYGERTIMEALARQTEHYTPRQRAGLLMTGAVQHAQHGKNGSTIGTDVAQDDEPHWPLPFSDTYNARVMVQYHGEDLRYCWPWHKWLVWTGTHWQSDDNGAVRQKAKQTIKRLARLAEDLDDTAAKTLMAHIKKSLSTAAIKAMIEGAQDEPGIPVLPEALDADPWLLNCTNGTLDLRTGRLRQPHDRTDLLTRHIAVAYDMKAICPTWDAFLDRIMAGNQRLISFLQRAVGYALTGVIREHVLLILWGSGRNGKSTFLNTLRLLLGPYAMKAPSELLLVSNNDRHPTERADLFGKRFVAAIETEQGRRLAEVFVKEATGGDPIRARRMREDFWEFQPTHKVFLATNHKPVITGTDIAIWERIRLIPFTVTIPKDERDTTLPDKLQAELPGILAWAIRGCLAWQQDGLGEPDEVRQATAGYRTEMDVLGQFIAECCLVGPNYRMKAADLYDAYKRWCEQNGERADIQRTWGMALTERGFESGKVNGRSWWKGIALTQVDDVDEGRPKNNIHSSKNPREGKNPVFSSTSSTSSTFSPPSVDIPGTAENTYDEGVI